MNQYEFKRRIFKTVENRSWKTDHRGLIAIHASTKKQRVTKYIREHKMAKLTSNMFTYSR